MLSALGRHHGWPRAELEALTIEDATWWCDAMVALREALKEAEEAPP